MRKKWHKEIYKMIRLIALSGMMAALCMIALLPAAGAAQRAASDAADLSTPQIIAKLEAHYTEKDFSADFFQESTLEAMDITDTAIGEAWFKYPGMMRWEYETPEKHAIITDGKTLWIYRPADNQVVIGDASAYFSNGKGASFLSNMSLLKDMFTITEESPSEEGVYTLKLIPHQKQLDLSAIWVDIDKKTFDIRSVVTKNAYGDKTRLQFTHLAFPKNLDQSLFEFQIPPGADVVKLDQ